MKNFLTLFIIYGLFTLTTSAQQLIKGYVVDDEKEPLIGATVVVKDSAVGTITDVNGNFQLTVPGGNNLLVVTYMGYTQQ